MTLDRETLARLSSASGFRPATLEKVLRLGGDHEDAPRFVSVGAIVRAQCPRNSVRPDGRACIRLPQPLVFRRFG